MEVVDRVADVTGEVVERRAFVSESGGHRYI